MNGCLAEICQILMSQMHTSFITKTFVISFIAPTFIDTFTASDFYLFTFIYWSNSIFYTFSSAIHMRFIQYFKHFSQRIFFGGGGGGIMF